VVLEGLEVVILVVVALLATTKPLSDNDLPLDFFIYFTYIIGGIPTGIASYNHF
jgi:hypothetical protein